MKYDYSSKLDLSKKEFPSGLTIYIMEFLLDEADVTLLLNEKIRNDLRIFVKDSWYKVHNIPFGLNILPLKNQLVRLELIKDETV